MFENYKQKLLPRPKFYRRMVRHFAFGCVLIFFSLGIGILGYHVFDRLSWLDAFENAAMILSGMGSMTQSEPDGGKFFAGCYALFSGLAFITSVSVMIAPALHRFLHKFHLEK